MSNRLSHQFVDDGRRTRFSATHPFPGPDNRDRAESASGHCGLIMRKSLIHIGLTHWRLYAVESHVKRRLASVSGSDGGLLCKGRVRSSIPHEPHTDEGAISKSTLGRLDLGEDFSGLNLSFRQRCESCLCESEAVAKGRLCGDVICKQGVHVVAYTVAQIVAFGAHTFQPDD
jgi:hypothetical protein